MNKISVIVPIYNSEKYLCTCIESIINQTYKNLEIILINDGSTDQSEKICLEYKKNDKRINLISRENKGVSYTRNQGIMVSTGEYICFIDSDDYIANDFIEILLKNIKNNDLATCGYALRYKNAEKNIVFGQNVVEYDRDEALNLLFSSNMFKGFLWNKIFKKEIIEKNNIHFSNNIQMCEDLLFVYKYILYSKKIRYIPKVEYFYRMRKNGISNKSNKLQTAIEAYEEMFNLFEKNNIEKNFYLLESFIDLNLNIVLNSENIENEKSIAIDNIIKYKKKLSKHLKISKKVKILLILKYPKFFNLLKNLRNKILGKCLFD